MKIISRPKILGTLLLGIFTLTTTSTVFADNVTSSAPTAVDATPAPATNDSTKDPSAILSAPAHDGGDADSSDNGAINQNNNPAKAVAAAAPAATRQSQDAIGNMLLQSVSLMGIAYKWGGNTPDTGMDCSGFVRYVFKKSLGIDLPRTAAEMARVGKRVSIDQLQPGDLIFFNTRRGSNTHIGIYLGGNKFIQSPRTGENIQISDLSGYWVQHFNGAKRVVQETSNGDGDTSLQNFQNIRDEALPVAKRSYSKKSRHSRHTTRASKRKGSHSTVVKTKSTTKSKTKSKKKH